MKVVHVPFTYAPNPVGGTEVYVSSLVSHLRAHGIESTVAAPGDREETYSIDDVLVDRYVASPLTSAADLYGSGDPVAARAFGEILDRRRPDVVHFHARTRAVSLLCLREAKARGLSVLYTYHTATGTCLRGSLLRWGNEPCDGRLDSGRCAACLLQSSGLPRLMARVVSALPTQNFPLPDSRTRKAIKMRGHVREAHRATEAFLAEVDRVVTLSDWGHALMRRLGVEPQRLIRVRPGLPRQFPVGETTPIAAVLRPLSLAFLGRMDRSKGLDILLSALARAPTLTLTLNIYGVSQHSQQGEWERQTLDAAARDKRVFLRTPLAASSVVEALGEYDALVIPSRVVEMAPLVILEAFSAGIPVIGSRLGGIAELVTEGVDGLLVEPESVDGWAKALRTLADSDTLAKLRAGVRAPRQMGDVATEMAAIYAPLIAASVSASPLAST